MTLRERYEATYNFQPVDHLPRQDMYIWPETIERWQGEELPEDWEQRNIFGFDTETIRRPPVDLGWCETPLMPPFEEQVLERRGDYEIIQDVSGRILRIFAERPTLAMPQYLRHPAETPADWDEDLKPRLDPHTPERWEQFETTKQEFIDASADGTPPFWVEQRIIGGYMFLRNNLGPEGVLLAFYDMPELIHDMMQTWLYFMDESLKRSQASFALDTVEMSEDICYKSGMLISPELFREFLLPYYQELVRKMRQRNTRRLYFHVDTDGNPDEAIPLYLECGMDSMDPFEVAAGQDVVEKGHQYPELIIVGGIDKRLMTEGADLSVLDRELERIIPPMLQRGGYMPMSDHGIPPDVPLANYIHYRQKRLELDH